MIINQPGAVFEYDGVNYVIGGPVVCTEASIYKGLYGAITEIRDGTDKDTDNETPDIYCSFDKPVHPDETERLEKAFSMLEGKPVTLDEIALDLVIMAPTMIKPLAATGKERHSITLYIVREHWAMEYQDGAVAHQFTDYHDAKRKFNTMLKAEIEGGCISRWSGNKSLCTDIGEDSYECWIDGEYLSEHYSLSISTEHLPLSSAVFDEIGKAYNGLSCMEDFRTSADVMGIETVLGAERYEAFINDPRIPGLVDRELDRGIRYWEEYWSAVDSAVCELQSEYEKQALEANGHDEQEERAG